MEKKIRTLGTLFAKSFSVNLDEVKRVDETAKRLVVRHPSAVSVIPMISSDEALVVSQFRYPVAKETIEFPAGKIDPGEKPVETAHRELAEETGYRAGRLTRLIEFAPSLGYSDEIIHIFVATELEPLDMKPDEKEISRVEPMKLSRIKEMIMAGEIIDGTTITSLAALEWSGFEY